MIGKLTRPFSGFARIWISTMRSEFEAHSGLEMHWWKLEEAAGEIEKFGVMGYFVALVMLDELEQGAEREIEATTSWVEKSALLQSQRSGRSGASVRTENELRDFLEDVVLWFKHPESDRIRFIYSWQKEEVAS